MKLKFYLLFIFVVFLLPLRTNATELNIIDVSTSSICLGDLSSPLTASFTSDQLFDRIENKSEKIEALEADVDLYDYISTFSVTLRIKNPDKFSITFLDGSSSIFFNGLNLWIYIKSLNECFYYISESSPFVNKWNLLMTMFDPKKFLVNMTRNTLTTLFEIKAVKREKISDGDFHYWLRMTPKFKNILIRVFELGYYEAVFSERLYLPIKVIEYDSNDKIKSMLFVKSYKLNEDVPDSSFDYENTTEAKLVPISEVIMQKFEDYKDSLM